MLSKDFKKMCRTAKGFAVFGMYFSIFECNFERTRNRDSMLNSFVAGGLTSALLAFSAGPQAMLMGGLGGGLMCAAFYNV